MTSADRAKALVGKVAIVTAYDYELSGRLVNVISYLGKAFTFEGKKYVQPSGKECVLCQATKGTIRGKRQMPFLYSLLEEVEVFND